MAESFPNEKKTLLEKEKLLVTSNFSFSNSVFERLVLQTRKNQGLFGKGHMKHSHKYIHGMSLRNIAMLIIRDSFLCL